MFYNLYRLPLISLIIFCRLVRKSSVAAIVEFFQRDKECELVEEGIHIEPHREGIHNELVIIGHAL